MGTNGSDEEGDAEEVGGVDGGVGPARACLRNGASSLASMAAARSGGGHVRSG